MLKKIIFALSGVALSNVAVAQSFPQPPDVPAYVAQSVSYAAGSTPNTQGTTPPAYSYEATDIPSDTTGRILTGTWPDSEDGFCTEVINGGTDPFCVEAKIRLHANSTHILKDDPIRNFGQPGTSHLHQFFGNPTVNAYTTYAKVRNEKWTAASGDVLNSTGYWFPCPIKTNPFADGHDYCVRMNNALIYYAEDPANQPLFHLIRGLRFVGGTEMDDPDDSLVKKDIATANAQAGTAGRYSYSGYGLAGWTCATNDGNLNPIMRADGSGSFHSLVLKNADGTDPWAGACPANSLMYFEFNGPSCWDGVNLWSPGGYKHVRYTIHDNTLGKEVCPQGWFRTPTLQIKFVFTVGGFTDYGNWRLSSDDGMASKLDSLPLCTTGYANAPCSETAGPHTVPNGKSFHTDWLGGWDGTIFTTWQQQCLGVDGHAPHQCFPVIISATQRLIETEAGPVRSPQVDLTTQYGTTDATKMFMVPTTTTGPKTMNMHQ